MNEQKPEARIDKNYLEVNHIFDTIQGEGPFAGTPATFIRLAGCNLQCTWCDTEYTGRAPMFPEDIVATAKQHLVVITGGEPFRQNLFELVSALLATDHLVQIETNGTIFDPAVMGLDCVVVVSPKTRTIDKRFESCDNVYYKMLIGPAFPSQPDNKGGNPHETAKRIDYIMPLDTQDEKVNRAINRQAVEYCLQHGTKLTIQQHKILDIP